MIVQAIKSSSILSEDDLKSFRLRLETHVFEYNRTLKDYPKNCLPARTLTPWIERGKIIVIPADDNTGQLVVDLVNNKELKIPGHELMAGWNLDLPEVAMVSIYFELISERDPLDIIEDEWNGIARMNGWDVERHEISLFNHNPHNKKKKATFCRVIVSRRVVDLIKGQKGQIWISGGTATVEWNGKPLDGTNEVHFNYQ